MSSPKPWIFALTEISAVSDLENLARAPLHYWGYHWCAASRELSWWFPGCPIHANISPYNRSISYCGFPIMTSSLPYSSWWVLIVTDYVRRSWRRYETFGGSKSDLGLVFFFWPGLCLSFKVIVLGLIFGLVLCPGKCAPYLTVPRKWRPSWNSLSQVSLLSNGLIIVAVFPLIPQRGGVLIAVTSKK